MIGKFVKAITRYATIAAMGSLVGACGAADSDAEYQATRNADHVPGQPTEDAMRCIERTVKATLENETNFSNWSAIKKEIYSLGCCWAGGGITLNILPKNPAGATFGCAVAYFGCKAKMLTSRSVSVERSVTTASVTITGRVLSLVPGISLQVRETAQGPVERFVSLEARR